jgi:hypothetical protein
MRVAIDQARDEGLVLFEQVIEGWKIQAVVLGACLQSCVCHEAFVVGAGCAVVAALITVAMQFAVEVSEVVACSDGVSVLGA